MRRFHLTSLLAGVLTAAVLLGVNVATRVSDTRGYDLIKPDFPTAYLTSSVPHIEVYEHSSTGSAYVSQGWPFRLRESPVRTKKIASTKLAAPWQWDEFHEIRWANCAANVLIGLTLALAMLAGVEFLLRRRDARRGER